MKISYRLEFDHSTRKHIAVCTGCGWRSPRLSTAGLAGSAFDDHKEEAHS